LRSDIATGHHLDAVDLADGSRQWQADAVDESGEKTRLVVADRLVYDVRRTTLTVWDLVTGERCTRLRLSGTAFGITGLAVADGTVYLTTEEVVGDEVSSRGVVAFDPQRGAVDWTYRDGGIGDITVVDGTIYVVVGDRLQALATDTGDEVWHVDTDNYSPSVTAAADRLLVTDRESVTAFATDGGEEQWRRTDVGTNAVIRAGETVFAVGGTQWELHALGADDGATRWRENLIWEATSAAVADGTLFVVNAEGQVYAYA
jgi:outer membrane protein assembly factor BamB